MNSKRKPVICDLNIKINSMDQLNSEFRNEIFDHLAALKIIENGLPSSQ